MVRKTAALQASQHLHCIELRDNYKVRQLDLHLLIWRKLLSRDKRGRIQSKLLKGSDSNLSATKISELSLNTNKCEEGPELNMGKKRTNIPDSYKH